jgi:hypothetical protein
MSRERIKVWVSTLFVLLLASCGDTIVVQECNNTNATVESSQEFKVTGIDVRSIGTATKKYEIDSKEMAIESIEDEDAFYALLDSLEVLIKIDGHLENENNPLSVQTGKFYNFEMAFNNQITFPKGLSFEFKLMDKELSGSYSKIIDYGGTSELNITGENALSIDTLIPTDVPDGEYVMLLNVVDERIFVDDTQLSPQNIKKITQLGSIALKVYSDSDSKRIEVVDTVDDGYIDLSKSMEFINGYSQEPLGESRFVNYNSSHLEHNISVSAILELEDGTLFTLGLLDVNEASVKEGAVHTIKVFNPNEIGVGDITLSYYIKEQDYQSLLNLIPDLSEDNTTDGAVGTIKWSVVSQEEDLILNNPQTQVLLSKFDDNFAYNPIEEQASLRESRSLVADATPNYAIMYDYDNGNTIVQDWKVASEGLKNFSLKSVDAAVDYDESSAYIFSGNQYIKLNKKDLSVSTLRPISYWNGVPFSKIDAGFNTKDYVYLFSGEEYLRYSKANNKMESGYPKKIKDDWSGLLNDGESLNAAITYDGNQIWFVVGEEYRGFDLSQKRVTSTSKFSAGYWKNMDKAFDAALRYDTQVIYFRNTHFTDAIKKLWAQGLLFKYDKEYDRKYGSRDKAAAEFSLKYGTVGSWKDLYVQAYGNSALQTYLFNSKDTIFSVDSEVIAGVKAKYGSSSSDKSRIGAKLKIEVMNNTWYEKDTITEEEKSQTISDDASKTKAVEESKEATKNKGFSLPNKEWKEERLLFAKSFMAGPVPIMLAGGVDGELSLKTSFDLEGIGAYLNGKVAGKIKGFIEGGLDVAILKITLRMDSTFADTAIEGKVGAKLDINDNKDFYFGLEAKLDTVLSILKVNLSANAKVGWKWLSKEGTINIWDSPWAFNQSYKLLDYSNELLTIPSENLFK